MLIVIDLSDEGRIKRALVERGITEDMIQSIEQVKENTYKVIIHKPPEERKLRVVFS